MKAKNLFGIIIAVVIVGLIFMLLSQESSKKVVIEDKQNSEQMAESKTTVLSDEDKVVEDLKKQAGAVNTENKGSVYFITHCSSCHGKDGGGTKVAPSIKGKPYDYIVSKLDDYRNDRVVNSLMKGLLLNTSDEDLKALAKEISNFK